MEVCAQTVIVHDAEDSYESRGRWCWSEKYHAPVWISWRKRVRAKYAESGGESRERAAEQSLALRAEQKWRQPRILVILGFFGARDSEKTLAGVEREVKGTLNS